MQPQFCWLSGMGKPKEWGAPWMLHKAHIASGTGEAIRVDDRRAIVLLCPLAHMCHVSNADGMEFAICKQRWPAIDARHTLYLKQKFDPEYYDRAWLQDIWIGQLPQAVKPPQFWLSILYNNTGLLLD